MRRWMPWLTAAFILIATMLILNVFREVSWDQVQRSLDQLDAGRLLTASLCVAGSYATLTWFDWLGIRHAGKRLDYPRTALASFTALSIGHTVGMSPFSAGGVRYRFYTRWGLKPGDVATVIVSSAITVTLGQFALATGALLIRPELASELLHLDASMARLIGMAGVAALVAWVAAAAWIRHPLRIRQWTIALPQWRIAIAQIFVGTVNYAFIAAALHRLIGPSADYVSVATAYVLGNVAALVSHVPGGIGVLEAVMMSVLPGKDVLGPLIAFRMLYYFAPLVLGIALFVGIELALRIRRAAAPAHPAADAASDSPA